MDFQRTKTKKCKKSPSRKLRKPNSPKKRRKKKKLFVRHFLPVNWDTIEKYSLPPSVMHASPETKRAIFSLSPKKRRNKKKDRRTYPKMVIKRIYEYTSCKSRNKLYALNSSFYKFLTKEFPLSESPLLIKIFTKFKYYNKHKYALESYLKRRTFSISFSNYLPLRAFVKYNNIKMINYILDRDFIHEHFESEFEGNILASASELGHEEIVILLLEYPYITPTKDGNLALIKAARNGRYDTCILLLMDKKVRELFTKNNTPIKEAKRMGKMSIVKLLHNMKKRKWGFYPNYFRFGGKRVIDLKMQIRKLIERKIDINLNINSIS